MRKRLHRFVLVAVGLTSLLSGCVISPRRTPGTTSGGAQGKLYVSTGSSILRFGNALTANTNVGPEATITGAATLLSSAQRLQVDPSTDRLFVANKGSGSIMIFHPASTITGNAAPAAVITSSSMPAPFDLAVDTGANNLLYVADATNNTVLVFSGQSSLSGTTSLTPARTITFTFTIGPIFLDAANNRLFVADTTNNGVAILGSASLQTGPAVLSGEVAGNTTNIQNPQGIALDGSGRLIVANFGGPNISLYPSAIVPTGGNVGPAATIAGSPTKLAGPQQILVNTNPGTCGALYVGDTQAASILTYANIANFTGTNTPTPTCNISGSSTQLTTGAVNGIALDTTH